MRDARANDTHERAHDPSPPPGPSPVHAVPRPRPRTRTAGRPAATGDRQLPLLMPVPAATRPQERPAHAPADTDAPHAPQGRQTPTQPAEGFGPPRVPWRALVAHERPDDAARVYRDRWTGDHATYLPDPTGT